MTKPPSKHRGRPKVTTQRPWEALGISRRTFERRRKKSEAEAKAAAKKAKAAARKVAASHFADAVASNVPVGKAKMDTSVIEALAELRVAGGGSISPAALIAAARDVNSPLHPFFHWLDDGGVFDAAGSLRRLMQGE